MPRFPILSLLALLFFSGNTQAATVGEACKKNEVARYYLKSDRYCFAEILTCNGGKLVRYDGVDRPANPEKCPGGIKPSCPYPMEISLRVEESRALSEVMGMIESISQATFNLNVEFQTDMHGATVKPWNVEIKAFPKSELPVFWHVPLAERPYTREQVKAFLEKKYPGSVKVELCPGQPESPSVVGSN